MSSIKNIAALIIITALSVSCRNNLKKGSENIDKNHQPNIIFLLCDDLRADALGYTGNTVIKTPNIDQLSNNGITFNNAYVTTSICAVSRASILTGQYARKHGIWGFAKSFSEEQLANTYPMLLKKAGYTVGFIGKYGVGHNAPQDKFNFWAGFNGQGTYKQQDDNGNPIHLTAKMGSQAVGFLNTQKDSGTPFCLSVSFKAPHVEGDPGYFLPDERFNHLYTDDTIPTPVASATKYFNYFPSHFTNNNVARNRWKDRFATPGMQQENIKKYYRLINGIDQVVGSIMQTLQKNEQDKNTIIIFTSDNGFYLGEYGFAGKWYGSDPSIRVPLIITDLRTEAHQNESRDAMVLNIDIAPTILSYAGVKPPEQMQGKDLSALIEKPTAPWRDYFFYEHLWQSSERYYIPSTEGVVYKDKKYMTYFKDFDNTKLIFEELYLTDSDPNEIHNLVDQIDYGALKKHMIEALVKARLEANR